MKNIIIKLLLIIFVFITLTFVGVFFLMKSNKILVAFDIIEVKNIYNTFTIKHEKVKAAVNYKIELMDSSANIVYSFYTEETNNTVIVNNMVYDMSYSLNIYAYDKDGNMKKANTSYDFVYKSPSINKDSNILRNEDYKLIINGDINDNDYYLIINQDNNELLKEKLNNSEYIIKKDYYYDKEVKLDVSLVCDGIVVDSISLFNNMNPISDIVITTPTNDTTIIYNNISLMFDGGDYAKFYSINIYNGKKLISSTETTKKKVLLSQQLFNVDKSYRIEVVGINEEYTKSNSVNFTISGKDKLKPVYMNVNPKAVKKGTKVELKQPDGANIYYTLNGDDPSINGMLYTEPIEINTSCTLRTVAIANMKDNSIVKDYNINVMNKDNLKIYISPSNQGGNRGVQSVGFTTEREEMNRIADYVIEKLKEYNVTTYRNNPAQGINQWNSDANYLGVDFKLAIHSNASIDHTSYGVETWIDSEYSDTYSIASLLQDKMIDMYPYKDREEHNRGVKYALGEIGEANDLYVRNGILIEVAHHDDLLDAKWMKENEKEIGYAMAEVILKYFQII